MSYINTLDRKRELLLIGVLWTALLVSMCQLPAPQLAGAHMTDPLGCEMLITKNPDRKLALSAGLSDDKVTFNYGYDLNDNGVLDTIAGYIVLPPAQQDTKGRLKYLPVPSVYWLDQDEDGKMDHMLVPLGAQDDCRYYIHFTWNGSNWVLITPHPSNIKGQTPQRGGTSTPQ